MTQNQTLPSLRVSAQTLELAPEGTHRGLLCDVVDLGMKDTQWGSKHRVQLTWQLESRSEQTGKRHTVSRFCTLTLTEGSNLRKVVEDILGRRLAPEELREFELESLLGHCNIISIAHRQTDSKTYANVTAIAGLMAGMESLEVEDFTRVLDRQDSYDVRTQKDHPVDVEAAKANNPFSNRG